MDDGGAQDQRWIIPASRISYSRTLTGRKVLLGKGAFGKVLALRSCSFAGRRSKSVISVLALLCTAQIFYQA